MGTATLGVHQGQSLVMTRQLQQAIAMLQRSNMDLRALVQEEAMSNPLLEYEEVSQEVPSFGEDDLPLSGYTSELCYTSSKGFVPDIADRPPTLREFLFRQLSCYTLSSQDRLCAFALIDRLDSSGWFTVSVREAAQECGVSAEKIETLVQKLQTLEPTGVFARSLEECLRLQVLEKGLMTQPMDTLLRHLSLLGARQYKRLCQICQVDKEALRSLVRTIQALNPKPGAKFEEVTPQSLLPDVFALKGADGRWYGSLNDMSFPRVSLYQAYVRDNTAYMRPHKQKAQWLIKNLMQRAHTILRVANEIISRQQDFFVRGRAHLHPMTLRHVAEALGLHESTVSRATTNKYLATPYKTYELKYFFSTAIQGSLGQASFSAETVRYRIKELIEGEPSDEPLSDETLVQMLQREGVDIARRTIAKYRGSMGVPSSSARRKAKMTLL